MTMKNFFSNSETSSILCTGHKEISRNRICMLGNPLLQGSHTFIVTFIVKPTGEFSNEFFKWTINNTNDESYPSSRTRVKK